MQKLEDVWNSEREFEDKVIVSYEEGIRMGLTRSETVDIILELAQGRDVRAFLPRDNPRGCQTDDYGTVIDPITLDEIPQDKSISFEDNGKIWCYNIEALGEHVRLNGATNPMTRSQLSLSVIEEIEDYFERNINVRVRVKGEGFDFSLSFPKTATYSELYPKIYDYLYENYQIPSLEAIVEYFIIPDGEEGFTFFEKKVQEGKIRIIQSDSGYLDDDYAFGYLMSLSKAFREAGMEAQFEAALDGLMRYVEALSFIDICNVWSAVNGYPASFYCRPRVNGGDIFSVFKIPSDYFYNLTDLVPGDVYDFVVGPGFLESWDEIKGTYSNDLDPNFDRVRRYAEESIKITIKEAIKNSSYSLLKRCFQITQEEGFSYSVEKDYLEIIQKFSPKKSAKLLSIFPFFRMEVIPKEFVNSGAYAKYLGVSNPEKFTKYLSGEKVDIRYIKEEILAVQDSVDFYEKHKPFVMKVLSPLLVRYRSVKVIDNLPEDDKLRIVLTMEKDLEKITFSSVPVLSGDLLDVTGATQEGFLFLCRESSDSLIKSFILKAGKEGRDIFRTAFVAVSYFDWFPSFFCQVEKSPIEGKESAYEELFSQVDFSQIDLEEIYDCLGPERSLKAFYLMKNKGDVQRPPLKVEEVDKVDEKLLSLVGEYGIISQKELWDFYVATGDKKLTLTFTKNNLKKIVDLSFLFQEFGTKDGIVVPEGTLLEFAKTNKRIQIELSGWLSERKILPDKLNVLGNLGLDLYLSKIREEMERKYNI